MSIVVEIPGYLHLLSDGSIKRLQQQTSPASNDSSSNGYKFKDVIINSTKPISARIFLLDTLGSSSLLPVLVYFHGGGFCVGSTTWLGYHTFLGDFAVASQSIILSVDYRLAPENRLPIAYDDCYSSLEWLSCQVNSEPWLERADLSRVFLSGDSAGGNIVHNVVLRLLQEKSCDQVKIKGLLIIHPFFGSEERTEKERASGGEAEDLKCTDLYWKLSLPEGSSRDHSWCNFEMAELSRVEWCRFPPVVVYVAGLDFSKERGVMYAAFLEKKGVEVKLVEAEGEIHVFHMLHPESEATRLLQKQMRALSESSPNFHQMKFMVVCAWFWHGKGWKIQRLLLNGTEPIQFFEDVHMYTSIHDHIFIYRIHIYPFNALYSYIHTEVLFIKSARTSIKPARIQQHCSFHMK